MGIIPLR
jgi:hypothetical protein